MELSVAERETIRDIEAICDGENDSRALRRQVAERLSRRLSWNASCFCTIDPWTLLVTDEVSYGIPRQVHPRAAHNEYLVPDVHKFVALVRSGAGVAVLGSAPEELRQASPRLRTILPLMDARHEIRLACTVYGQCWGALAMFRTGDRPDFSAAEAALLHAVSAPVAAGLRRTAYLPGAEYGITADASGPGVLILGPRNETLVANDAARHWLDELSPVPHKRGESALPFAVHQVAARVQAVLAEPGHESDGRQGTGSAPRWIPGAYARLRTRSGRWVTVHGSRAGGDLVPGAGGTAVVLEPAPASDIAEVLMLAYGLTRRERQLLQRVIAGTSSTAIAAQLGITANTVQDHLKSIFAKVGVRSRGQLVARVLGEHYLPLLEDRDPPDAG